ncbi:microtubule binding protein [Phaffia rhodozyma]|uniref:Coronin n=1 Tax=Phaffia rhodozyma TaxID=264483 RepID=A0A0F7SSY7_PHARH|nr:microtubule binding protein [Phaffia rhodozyma]
MSRFMRSSKYRHVFADKPKKEHSYENVKVSNSAWDTDLVAAGGAYISVNWNVSGGGAFAVLPTISPFNSAKPRTIKGKLPDILPLARGHSGAVLDTAWSPFDDSIVASGAEDGKVNIYKIDPSKFEGWGEDGWVAEDFQPDVKINAGGRKIGQVLFHPTASNVLAATSGDHVVRLFDVENGGAPKISLEAHGDSIQGLTWNMTGTILATTSRDKKLRMFDPRAGSAPVRITDGHAGVKGSRLVWLGVHDRIATTGFSKSSDRQVKIWETGGLSEIKGINIDQSSGVLMPFFSEANNLLFLAGKGDGNIRYYEYEADNLFYLSEYGSQSPQRGMTFLPRRALDVSENEVARGFKITGNLIEPLGFVVPRKADSFQADIFPPALSSDPALSADDWFAGKTAQPKLVSLEDGATPVTSDPVSTSSTMRAVPSTSKTAPAALSSPAPQPAKTEEPPKVASPEPTLTPTPPAVAVEEDLPAVQDLDIKQEEEDSENEDEQPSPVRAEFTTAASTPPIVPAADGEDTSIVDQQLRNENQQLTEDLKEARSKIRQLEQQVESMKADASKIVKQLTTQFGL